MVKLVGGRVLGVAVGAAGGGIRGCVGGVRQRRVLPSGGACPQRISRQNEKFKNCKVKNKNRKKNKRPGPPPYLFWASFCFGQMVGALAAAVPNSRISRPAGLGSWTSGAPHLFTLETPHPACRRRPAHANTISAERPRKQLARGQTSEQWHAGMHPRQTHVASRCVSRRRRDRPAWCRTEPASDESRQETRLCSISKHGPQGNQLMAPPSSLPNPEPPATDCDSRGQTRCSDLSRQVDCHGAPGSFWQS